MQVIFETPGNLDIQAIATSPIGFFGTWLKYAIAVLLREGCQISIFTNKTLYRFSIKRPIP